MNFIFYKLQKLQKHEFHFFCKLKNLEKHEFHCFCKLKNLKKHEFHFFGGGVWELRWEFFLTGLIWGRTVFCIPSFISDKKVQKKSKKKIQTF